MIPSASSTPPLASTITRAGSPTDNRKATGRAFPPPLSFAGDPQQHPDSRSTKLEGLTSPPYSARGIRHASPFTPDRPEQRRMERSPRSPMDSQTRREPGQSRMFSNEARFHNGEPDERRDDARGQRTGAKLAQSTSSASGRPRNTQSVLGYSSYGKKGTSPGRASRPEAGLAASSQHQPAQGLNGSSRYLLTVIPPSHLPHDPPHPRTNPQCSGYGPPEHFKRGTLVPLYPTLSSQVAAIAREYGLPSTGGLVLYLLSTIDPSSSSSQALPGSAGFTGEGGPRISDAAWSLLWARLFEEEQELYLVADDEVTDEEEFAPPVPPIPPSHQPVDDDDARSRQPSDEQAIFSGEDDHERTSFSSDAGLEADDPSASDKSKSRRSSASSRNALGRGAPPALPSPGPRTRPSHRFSHSQQRYVSLPTSAASTPQRVSSHNSLRSARTGLPPFYHSSNASGRSVSHGSYASSFLSSTPAPGYGASVVVGKVEFDIDRRGAKGKWYDSWAEGAMTITQGAVESAPAAERWQELQLPDIVKAKELPPSAQEEAFSFSDTFTPPQSDDISTMEHDTRARTLSGASRGMDSATSAWSLAAMAERVEQTEAKEAQEEEQAEDSFVDKEQLAARSRPTSMASTALVDSDKEHSEADEEHALVGDEGYSQLEDEEESQHLTRASFSDEPSEKGSDAREVRDFEKEGEEEQETEEVADQPEDKANPEQDPLGDVFESDEATWQALSTEPAAPRLREQDSLETTGLGIVGARINALAATAPTGVIERLPEEQAIDEEQEQPLPENDVGEVFSMLHSAQAAALAAGPLASPIRLDDSPKTALERGLSAGSRDVDKGEEHPHDSPFKMAHSTNTSVSTVNFNVRPPSTIASMSPEYIPQRKQRQGWTNVPAVVEASISPSSSMSSIAVPDSQRASTIGLMENLDDLERALAELSPRANKLQSPNQPEAIPEEPTQPVFAPPPRSSSREPVIGQEDQQEAPSSTDPASPLHLMPRHESRPEFTPASSFASEESFVTAVPAPEISPSVEPTRIPRSSSLSKGQDTQAPHLIALPPSPLPPSPSSVNSNEAADDHTPTVDTVGPDWSTLPQSPPRLPISVPEPELPPIPAKAEDNAPAVAPSTGARSPGPIKSLRMNKPWGNKDNRTAKQPSPDPNADEPPVPKSPLGAFFGKSTFGKAKGFFKKSESSQDDHATNPNPTVSPEIPIPALPSQAAPPPVRKDSLEATARPVPTVSETSLRGLEDATTLPESSVVPGPTPGAPFSSVAESIHSGPISRPDSPFYNEATPDYPPSVTGATPASPLVSPHTTLSPTANAFPQPPSMHASASSPSRADVHLASPRSEYLPSTPRAGPTGTATSPGPGNNASYPASAPVTPAEWPNARFGGTLGGAAQTTPASERSRRKPRLSADIDQLLSQMNDIDFGIGGDDDDAEGDDVTSPVNMEVSPQLVEPNDDYLTSQGQTFLRDQHNPQGQDSSMLGVQGNAHRGILSADLSALGSMMTGFASPPLSPEAPAHSTLSPNVS
ncbi:uncharacterized protein JCM15063_005960 [Sporobolomyces koalae]|uniref:uncharacterized protein n=1 Tax=Sporobolomyces koalae TaxID=500713 RepID=UPI00316CAD9C